MVVLGGNFFLSDLKGFIEETLTGRYTDTLTISNDDFLLELNEIG